MVLKTDVPIVQTLQMIIFFFFHFLFGNQSRAIGPYILMQLIDNKSLIGWIGHKTTA